MTAMRAKPLFGRDEGGPAIEAAIALLLLAVSILGVFEFAFGYWVLNSMESAVAAGGRYALAHRLKADFSGACNPTVVTDTQSVVAAALPSALTFVGPTVSCTGNTGAAGCCQGSAPTTPATLNITVHYANTFLSAFIPYTIASADTVTMD